MSNILADQVRSSILNLAIGSFLAGMFLIVGLQFAVRGEALCGILLMVPVMVVVSIGHAARITRAFAERGHLQGDS